MRNIWIFVTCFFCIGYSSISAQELIDQQQSLIIKISADWCPNCGDWGWDFYEHLIDDNDDNAIFLTGHHSGGLVTQAGRDLAENYDIPYQPFFIVNNEVVDVSQSTAASKRLEVKSDVQNQATMSPAIKLGMDVYAGGLIFMGQIKVEFVQETQGDYYLGVYGVDDHVIAYQSQQGQNADHRYLLRDHGFVNDVQEVFGSPIANGDIAAGAIYDASADLSETNMSGWLGDENAGIVAIVWKKVGDAYVFENALMVTGDQFINDTNEEDIEDFSWTPSFGDNQLLIDLNSSTGFNQLDVEIYNLAGQVIASRSFGRITARQQQISIPLNQQLEDQILLISLRTDRGIFSKKLNTIR